MAGWHPISTLYQRLCSIHIYIYISPVEEDAHDIANYCRRRQELIDSWDDIPAVTPPVLASLGEPLHPGSNEVYLLHGTSPENVSAIIRQGFDPAIASLHGDAHDALSMQPRIDIGVTAPDYDAR